MSARGKHLLLSLYPGGFAAGYVLLSFANLPTPANGLWRPLVIAAVGAALLSLGLGAVIRNRAIGALVATCIVLALGAIWLLVAIAAVVVAWVGLVILLRRTRNAEPLRWPGTDAANRMAGVFAITFALVTIASAAPPVVHSLLLRIPEGTASTNRANGPNIYLFMLDGYPRSDVLRTHLGYDNSEFEESLTQLGFDVASDSRSNYSVTWATLASMFQGQYLQDLDSVAPFPTDQTEQFLSLMRAINEGAVLADLRGRGYRIVTIPSPFDTASLITADEVASGGQLTFFELSLLQHSRLLGPIMAIAPDFVLDEQRGRLAHALAASVSAAETTRGDPTFLFSHILNPHPPIVFNANGEPARPPACFPATCTLWEMHDDSQWDDYPEQVQHLNQLVSEAASRIVAADPDGVIVIMSDHGTRPPDAPEEVVLNTFLAVRSPGNPLLMDASVHPVDLLPAILDAYFGTETPRHGYRGWISVSEHPLDMIEVTEESSTSLRFRMLARLDGGGEDGLNPR